jgi:ABC-2 type transport system permease protein
MALEGGRFLQVSLRSLTQDFLFVGNLFNGWLVANQIMNSLWFHIPFLITFVAGDMLAGEATTGTYRLILIRPVSRMKIFFAKYIVTISYTILFVIFLALLSVSLALILFGSGDLIIIRRIIYIIPESEVLYRFLAAYSIAIFQMFTIASIAFFFSSFVENAIGPIVSTMGVLIIFGLISTLPVELFKDIKPFIFTTYMDMWQKIFIEPIPWKDFLPGLLCYFSYAFTATLGALLIFLRKDILS